MRIMKPLLQLRNALAAPVFFARILLHPAGRPGSSRLCRSGLDLCLRACRRADHRADRQRRQPRRPRRLSVSARQHSRRSRRLRSRRRLNQAKAQADDLSTGARPPEIKRLEAHWRQPGPGLRKPRANATGSCPLLSRALPRNPSATRSKQNSMRPQPLSTPPSRT
jgi:hypothetical protein